ncbi:uncharacterized protein [Dysidea avara]|uniref:uncharacterized protein n=1 Tax=Dysidea avara TaxID=196820 RepID=UPI0033185AAA
MARNHEKQYGALNRYVLAKEREKLPSRRPPLHVLTKVEDVKKWIPDIKREMEYTIQQMTCKDYSEQKIEAIKERLERLKREYRGFVQKVYTLDPTTDAIPWNSRAYSRKRRPLTDQHVVEDTKRILVEETAERNKCVDEKKEEVTSKRSVLGISYSSSSEDET